MATTSPLRAIPRALVLLLAVVALIVPTWRPLPTTAATPVQNLPLDLAAMVLTSTDLAGAGQDGYGWSAGRILSVDNLADRVAWPEGQGETFALTRDTLLYGAAWRQGYEVVLTTIRDFDNPGPIRDVEIELDAYADPTGAATGFALVPDAYATGEMTPIEGTVTIGDESRITQIDAHDPGAGTPSPELAIGFRLGHLTARVLIRDQGDRPPTVAEVEALARALDTKIQRSLAEEPPALGLHALRVTPKDDMTVAQDGYLRLNGHDTRSAFESTDELATRTSTYGESIDVFTSSTEVAAADSTYSLSVKTTLYRFATTDQASAWLQEAPDRLKRQSDVTKFTVMPHLAKLGDDAAAITITQNQGGDYPEIWQSAIVFVRVGATVAEVRLERVFDAPSVAAAFELAEQQAECLGAQVCLDPLAVSISASGELDESPQDHQADAISAATVFKLNDDSRGLR